MPYSDSETLILAGWPVSREYKIDLLLLLLQIITRQTETTYQLMILGMIDLTTHDEKTLRVVEGQVLDDSKNTIITKEEDGFVNLFQFVRILFMTL